MNSKNYAIGILFVTAVMLFIAHFLPVPPALANVAIKERDYSVVTARTVAGGDALYIADNRSGNVAVFTWDASRRMVVARDVQPISMAFQR